MTNVPSSTGVAPLDADIRRFYEILQDADVVATAKDALSNMDIGYREFKHRVPAELIRLAMASRDGSVILGTVDENGRRILAEVADKLDSEFGDILKSPLAFAVVSEMANEAGSPVKFVDGKDVMPAGGPAIGVAFEQVAKIVSGSIFVRGNKALAPLFQVQFLSMTGRRMFDANMLWPSAFFVLGTLAKHLAIEIAACAELRKQGSIELDDNLRIAVQQFAEGQEKLVDQLIALGYIEEVQSIGSDQKKLD